MDPEIISKLELSESEQARLSALDESTYTTPEQAKAMANKAFGCHEGLAAYVSWFRDNGFPHYSDFAGACDRVRGVQTWNNSMALKIFVGVYCRCQEDQYSCCPRE